MMPAALKPFFRVRGRRGRYPSKNPHMAGQILHPTAGHPQSAAHGSQTIRVHSEHQEKKPTLRPCVLIFLRHATTSVLISRGVERTGDGFAGRFSSASSSASFFGAVFPAHHFRELLSGHKDATGRKGGYRLRFLQFGPLGKLLSEQGLLQFSNPNSAKNLVVQNPLTQLSAGNVGHGLKVDLIGLSGGVV